MTLNYYQQSKIRVCTQNIDRYKIVLCTEEQFE